MSAASFPHVVVSGGPFERGRQHGQQAGDLIAHHLRLLTESTRPGAQGQHRPAAGREELAAWRGQVPARVRGLRARPRRGDPGSGRGRAHQLRRGPAAQRARRGPGADGRGLHRLRCRARSDRRRRGAGRAELGPGRLERGGADRPDGAPRRRATGGDVYARRADRLPRLQRGTASASSPTPCPRQCGGLACRNTC